MKSGEKEPQPTHERQRLGPLETDGPNVTTLVRMCGNVFAFRWLDGKVVFRRLTPSRGED